MSICLTWKFSITGNLLDTVWYLWNGNGVSCKETLSLTLYSFQIAVSGVWWWTTSIIKLVNNANSQNNVAHFFLEMSFCRKHSVWVNALLKYYYTASIYFLADMSSGLLWAALAPHLVFGEMYSLIALKQKVLFQGPTINHGVQKHNLYIVCWHKIAHEGNVHTYELIAF